MQLIKQLDLSLTPIIMGELKEPMNRGEDIEAMRGAAVPTKLMEVGRAVPIMDPMLAE